ncbi:hypothetical protein LTV02_30945 [Nocardia yamanashiensis]|uniref:hypothetical protein n=1 Tax=Nocardia yamanashiensis TaxID=209247 RepID=UPI001E3E3E7C|nr:hypothetical protein [Nocardia yamanashiensis]UGT40389.1 hypothetical protein LTV02_30945 [Nocardia yamanashiensis]
MDVQVIPGRMVEVPTADATGMDRRAFGEFIGPQGELASYALGWITGGDEQAGRMSVGIGAGNEGGGTFHIVVFPHDGTHAYGLVDTPFESVPQGGRDFTRAEGLAHHDLPFIWWVVDRVMERDPRAWWMKHWIWRTNCIQTKEVFEQQEPVLLVTHDADDGMWQLIGSSDAGPGAKLGHLWHAIDEDPTLMEVLDLEAGQRATRDGAGERWTRGTGQWSL